MWLLVSTEAAFAKSKTVNVSLKEKDKLFIKPVVCGSLKLHFQQFKIPLCCLQEKENDNFQYRGIWFLNINTSDCLNET